jgi:maltokinase
MKESMRHDLTHYIRAARWFGGKGREFEVVDTRRLGRIGQYGATDLVELHFADSEQPEFYQLPLSFYPARHGTLGHALIGTWSDPDFGRSFVYDATHDRDVMQAWLERFAANATATDPGGLSFHRLPGHELDLEVHSTLFTGEQSNSSVAFGEDSLLKIFRKITPGVNPDVEIHAELTRAGSDHVAALYGWLEYSTAAANASDLLHLAMLQQFLRTATDGWDLAQASVRNLFAAEELTVEESGGDFAGEAARLGVALAETHQTLAEHFPTATHDQEAMAALAAAMNQRLDAAIAITPRLAPYAPALRTTYAALSGLGEVRVQRIHGDLHLGQTLRTVKGWKIVDFEGEPAAPLALRRQADSRWRDVAGMLRSFDYAPRAVERSAADGDVEEALGRRARAAQWVARNQEAFLLAYAGQELTDDEQVLLAAYTADKAVYETVYESRNRPTWVPIPLEALAKIGAR